MVQLLMGAAVVALNDMEWVSGAHPLEKKKAGDGVTLLEFAPGFADPSWCTNGHVIFMLSGQLELQLDERTVTVETGEACVVDEGTRHRARNPNGEVVRLLVFSPCLVA